MKLWRLCRAPHVALDGAGAMRFGGRYSSPGRPVVSLASEAGLAVLVTLRYLTREDRDAANDYRLGWTAVDAEPVRAPVGLPDLETRAFVDDWLETRRSLLAAIRSKVLPEADVVLLNPRHPDAMTVRPLVTRPFSFAECLHEPPMLNAHRERG